MSISYGRRPPNSALGLPSAPMSYCVPFAKVSLYDESITCSCTSRSRTESRTFWSLCFPVLMLPKSPPTIPPIAPPITVPMPGKILPIVAPRAAPLAAPPAGVDLPQFIIRSAAPMIPPKMPAPIPRKPVAPVAAAPMPGIAEVAVLRADPAPSNRAPAAGAFCSSCKAPKD